MRALIRPVIVLGCLALGLLAPREASAITVDQIVSLKQAGVTDTVILALIDRDRTVFAIEPEQIVALQRDGLSERVILAMLKSGREEGDQQARAESANASAWIMSNLATEPISISVGHGPDRPNTPHLEGSIQGRRWRASRPPPTTGRRSAIASRCRSAPGAPANRARSATRRSAPSAQLTARLCHGMSGDNAAAAPIGFRTTIGG